MYIDFSPTNLNAYYGEEVKEIKELEDEEYYERLFSGTDRTCVTM